MFMQATSERQIPRRAKAPKWEREWTVSSELFSPDVCFGKAAYAMCEPSRDSNGFHILWGGEISKITKVEQG